MNGLLISLLNVLVIVMAIVFALRFGRGAKAGRNGRLLLLSGTGAYVVTGVWLVAEGRCRPGDTAIEILVRMSDCIGLGDKLLLVAQAAVIGGALILASLQVRKLADAHLADPGDGKQEGN